MATMAVTIVPVLLFKMRCMSLSLSRLFCVISQKKVLGPFLPLLSILFYGGPLYLHALPSRTVFDSLS